LTSWMEKTFLARSMPTNTIDRVFPFSGQIDERSRFPSCH
jgi:hypothetical protein